jgi:hypothetical protein
MTEQEWLANPYVPDLLDAPVLSDAIRKKRLFACGCCRLIWDQLVGTRSRKAVRKLEEFADAISSEKMRRDAYNIANAAFLEMQTPVIESNWTAACAVVCAANRRESWPNNLFGNVWSALRVKFPNDAAAVSRAVTEVFRDIFGNPFRPVAFDPAWRTATAVARARQMYDSRDFGAMPILADALQDAGCEDEYILTHCRDTSVPHVRGCWVCDLVLDRL